MKKRKKKLFMLKVKRWISFFFLLRVDEFFFLVGKRDCNLLLKGLERNLTKTLVELIHNHLVGGVWSLLSTYFLIHRVVIHRREYFRHLPSRMHIIFFFLVTYTVVAVDGMVILKVSEIIFSCDMKVGLWK